MGSNGDTKDPLREMPAADPLEMYLQWEQAVRGYKQFCAVAAAVRLRLFDALEDHRRPGELSAILGTAPELTVDLCDLLADGGLLVRNEEGFANTPASRTFLCSRSAYFQEEVIRNILSGVSLWEQLDRVCCEGPVNVDEAVFFENNLIDSLASEILVGELQATVTAITRQEGFREARRLLDLGGGHGLYAMALCRYNPDLEAVVFDFPPIEKDFQRYLARFGGCRVRFSPGNLFADDLGRDYDVVLLSYNPGGKNPRVLEKIKESLKPGGLFVSKHAFYRRGEGSKSRLMDIEWQLTTFRGVGKGRRVYAFEHDLCLEDYLALLRHDFDILESIESDAFATAPLAKFGDRLDSNIILSRKKRT